MRGAHSGPTARTLDVLELLAEEPKGIRYVDIVRKLKLNQGTAHSILKTLVDRAWVHRDANNKSFTLGPMVAQIGAAQAPASSVFSELSLAARELCLELGFSSSVIEHRDNELVVVASFHGSRSTSAPEIGTTAPYSPPYGAIFACSRTETERLKWLSRASTQDITVKKTLERTLDLALKRGFDLDWTNQAMTQVSAMRGSLARAHPSMAQVMDQILLEHANLSIGDADPDRSVTSIIAADTGISPTQPQSSLGLAVHPMMPLPTNEIERIGTLLAKKVKQCGEHARKKKGRSN